MDNPDRENRTSLAIVGGGLAGAAIAYHVQRLAGGSASVALIEPRPRLGYGVAYDTVDPAHRLNVPSGRMSLLPDDPEDFDRWLRRNGELEADPEAIVAGLVFARRRAFGRYVEAHLNAVAGRIDHHRDEAVAAERRRDGWALYLRSGRRVDADRLVLAVSHPPPSPPGPLAESFAGDPRFVADPWRPDALTGIAPTDPVLVVGTGLTMADIVASLDRQGHRGPILAVSRRGLTPRTHYLPRRAAWGDFASDPSQTALGLLRRIRRAVAEAAQVGSPWQDVVDTVRAQGRTIWMELPETERRRLLRHLRIYWDVHRYRIAPQVAALLEAGAAAGRLAVRAATVSGARLVAGGLSVTLRPRRSSAWTQTFGAVVVATGPAHGSVVPASPLLGSLAAAGRLRADRLQLGLETDTASRAVNGDGVPQDDLLVAGPLARATFGELMGANEIVAQTRDIAAFLSTRVA